MRDTISTRKHTLALAGLWFLAGALLSALLPVSAHPQLDTYVSGVAARIGYWGDWGTRFHVGEPLQLLIDTSMPAGYERIYVRQGREIIGALPGASAVQVRAALAAGYQPRARITSLDPLDPARGVRLRIAFEGFNSGAGRWLAGDPGSALRPLL